MKRQWRTGQTILGVMLIGIAMLTAYLWPRQPRWVIPFDMQKEHQQILGVDEKKNILFTRHQDFSAIETSALDQEHPPKLVFQLQAYDLWTGRQLVNQPDPPEANTNMMSPSDMALSPTRNQLACVKTLEGIIQLYDLPIGPLRASIQLAGLSPGEHLRVAYSDKGDLLLVRSDRQLYVYDAKTAKPIHHIEIPKHPKQWGGRGNWAFDEDGLKLSTNQDYLAMMTNFSDSILVFNVRTKKVIGECPDVAIARFVNNGQTLVCIPEIFDKHQAKWYRLNESEIAELPISTSERVHGGFLYCNDQYFVTAELMTPQTPPFWFEWKWLSEETKVNIAHWLGRLKYELEISLWNINTGTLERRFPLVLPLQLSISMGSHRNYLLSDSRQIVINDGAAISLWDMPPRRSVTCWIVCSSVMLLAFWLTWPRKLKLA